MATPPAKNLFRQDDAPMLRKIVAHEGDGLVANGVK